MPPTDGPFRNGPLRRPPRFDWTLQAADVPPKKTVCKNIPVSARKVPHWLKGPFIVTKMDKLFRFNLKSSPPEDGCLKTHYLPSVQDFKPRPEEME